MSNFIISVGWHMPNMLARCDACGRFMPLDLYSRRCSKCISAGKPINAPLRYNPPRVAEPTATYDPTFVARGESQD